MVDDLPLSRKHSRGFGYRDYFTKNGRGTKIFQIMKVLAMRGPMTKYSMSSLPARTTEKSTRFGWTQVHRYITTLQNNNLVKQFGVQRIDRNLRDKGKKHEASLYGLTPMGIVLTCIVDEKVFRNRQKIIENYSKYEKGLQKGRIGTIWDNDKRIEVYGEYETAAFWGDTKMLLRILSFTRKAVPKLPKTRAIFSPENLDAIKQSTLSVDLRPFSHFFDTLSDEVAEIVQKRDKSELDVAINHLAKYELLKPLLEWIRARKSVLEHRLGYMEETILLLDQELGKDKVLG